MRSSEAYRVPKIVMDSKERDYQLALKQATSQGDGNPQIFGYQPLAEELVGATAKLSPYDAPTRMPQNVTNMDNGFQQLDHPSNSVSVNPVNTTGSVGMGTSATAAANESPSEYQTDALARRLAAYTEAQGNSRLNLNNLSQTGTLA